MNDAVLQLLGGIVGAYATFFMLPFFWFPVILAVLALSKGSFVLAVSLVVTWLYLDKKHKENVAEKDAPEETERTDIGRDLKRYPAQAEGLCITCGGAYNPKYFRQCPTCHPKQPSGN